MKKSFLPLAVIAILGTSGCSLLGALGDAKTPKSGDGEATEKTASGDDGETASSEPTEYDKIQDKYYKAFGNWGAQCEPYGILKTHNDMGCRYHPADGQCKVGYMALKGEPMDEYAQLYRDALVWDPNRESYTLSEEKCNIAFIDSVAVAGLAYINPDDLVALYEGLAKDEETFNQMSTNRRKAVVYGLWLGGKKEAGIAYAKRMLLAPQSGVDKSSKPMALKMLQRWDSDEGLEWAKSAVAKEKYHEVRSAAALYLGQRQHKESFEIITRMLTDRSHEQHAARALGAMGDKRAVEHLKADKNWPRNPWRVAALLQLGDAETVSNLEGYILRPRSSRQKPGLPINRGNYDVSDVQKMSAAMFEVTNPKVKWKLESILKKSMNANSEDWQFSVYPAVALAQRGDAAAIKKVIELLKHTEAKARKAVVGLLGEADPSGGRWGSYPVASTELVTALLALYDMEADEKFTMSILESAVACRAQAAYQSAK